ncbi:MAG TPA: methionine ABC transporter ATP-binding protein, partial [Achromobacter sp.]|nr:methionine ABC transporter ATP-binding protein [Achromobacter sp.]
PGPDAHIVFEGLQKRYQSAQGTVAALSDVSFQVARGEVFGII